MLLRALQEREFCRLGSSRPVPFKARLVFATNRNIEKMVSRGEFRSDLYYRINVIRIKSPALRERPEDIPIIVRSLIKQFSASLSKDVYDIEPDAIRALQAQPWHGNVRELENIVQRAMIATTAKTIRLTDLGFLASPLNAGRRLPGRAGSGKYDGAGGEMQEPQLNHESENVVYINDRAESSSFMQLLQDYRLMLAESALREHKGNKTLAARSLQISRAYLHRILRNSGTDDLDKQFAEVAV
jgi:transcriptional regulator with PAS, ATPase and Fis domain